MALFCSMCFHRIGGTVLVRRDYTTWGLILMKINGIPTMGSERFLYLIKHGAISKLGSQEQWDNDLVQPFTSSMKKWSIRCAHQER